jgi:hypothetical protein
MEKKTDALLRNLIKNWAGRYNPPDNGRARLLWNASRLTRNKTRINNRFFRPQSGSYTPAYSNEWTQTLFTWIDENSLQFGLQARLS